MRVDVAGPAVDRKLARPGRADAAFYASGLGVFCSLLLQAWLLPSQGSGWHLGLLAMAVAGYLCAIACLGAGSAPSRRALAICLVLAALGRVPLVLAPPGPQDDVYRYLWDGRVQRLGYDPYRVVPSDPAVAHLHTPQTRQMNNPGLPTIYPPGAQWFFRLVTSVHESVPAVRAALVLCEILIVLLLLQWLAASARAPGWVLAYAWNPLVALEVARNGHVDALGTMLIAMSAVALLARWRTTAAVAFAGAVGVKFLPVVLLPLYWRRLRPRDAAAGVAAFAMLYLPFIHDWALPAGSLGRFIDRFRFNAPVFEALELLVQPRGAAGLAIAIGLTVAVALRHRDPREPAVWAWPMAAALLCAPAIYPWYLIWLAPFLFSTASRPLLVWTISIVPVYLVWHVPAWRDAWTVPPALLVLEFGALVVAAWWTLRRGRAGAWATGVLPQGVR